MYVELRYLLCSPLGWSQKNSTWVMWLWEPVLGPPISFFPITTIAWSYPYLSLLTSAATIYKEAKNNDAKAKILAATISDIMEKAQEDSQALPDNLKKVSACLCLFYTFTWQGQLPIENPDMVPQFPQARGTVQLGWNPSLSKMRNDGPSFWKWGITPLKTTVIC